MRFLYLEVMYMVHTMEGQQDLQLQTSGQLWGKPKVFKDKAMQFQQ